MPWYTPTRSTEVSVFDGRITRPISSGSSSARAAAESTASAGSPGCSITVCIQRWRRGSGNSRGGCGKAALLSLCSAGAVRPGAQRLGLDHVEGGDVPVPLEERRDIAGARDGVTIELPDLRDRVVVMRVDDVRALIGVAREVVLGDARRIDRVEILPGIEPVVEGADVHVVDVEQHPAVGLLHEPTEKLPLRHARGGELGVGRSVLEHERALEEVRDRADTPRSEERRVGKECRSGW